MKGIEINILSCELTLALSPLFFSALPRPSPHYTLFLYKSQRPRQDLD